jgi:anthranilate synthase component 1
MFFIRMGATPSSVCRQKCWCGAGTPHRDASDRRHAQTRFKSRWDQRLTEELRRSEGRGARDARGSGLIDIGRVFEVGSVRFRSSWRWSATALMHLVSRRGQARRGQGSARRAGRHVPGGHADRRLKIRAMQITGGLEPPPRALRRRGGPDPAGNLDFCIAIRTITMRDGRAECAGAGIVADCIRRRYEETRDSAPHSALEMATGASDGSARRQP